MRVTNINVQHFFWARKEIIQAIIARRAPLVEQPTLNKVIGRSWVRPPVWAYLFARLERPFCVVALVRNRWRCEPFETRLCNQHELYCGANDDRRWTAGIGRSTEGDVLWHAKMDGYPDSKLRFSSLQCSTQVGLVSRSTFMSHNGTGNTACFLCLTPEQWGTDPSRTRSKRCTISLSSDFEPQWHQTWYILDMQSVQEKTR